MSYGETSRICTFQFERLTKEGEVLDLELPEAYGNMKNKYVQSHAWRQIITHLNKKLILKRMGSRCASTQVGYFNLFKNVLSTNLTNIFIHANIHSETTWNQLMQDKMQRSYHYFTTAERVIHSQKATLLRLVAYIYKNDWKFLANINDQRHHQLSNK